MRISADCIDQELDLNARPDNEQSLSQRLARMALNDEQKTGQQIRVIYKVNYDCVDPSLLTSLSVIPVTDYYRTGYHSEWEEVKQQIIEFTYKDKSKVPNGLQFVAVIKGHNHHMDINSRDDYFTALKLAEISGQPLDVMIKKSSEPVVSQTNTGRQAVSSPSKTNSGDNCINAMKERQNSVDSNAGSSTESNNGFVLLDNRQESQSTDKFVIMSEDRIEKLKKDITIDVTKRLISKLNECLTELTTNDNSSQSHIINDYLKGAEGGHQIPKVVHTGIICDNCDKQIEGVRYKCINCLDYDLCEPCKQKPVHFPSHTFNKIERYIPGIPKQTLPPSLDFLKPFLSGATIDPSTKDVVLTLDVDLTNGTICKSNVSQQTNNSADQPKAEKSKSDEHSSDSANNTNKKSPSDDESTLYGPQLPHKRYCSEKRAKQITKKLEKLKQKSQLYNNLLQPSEDRPTHSGYDRSKQSTAGPIIPNPSIVSNKTLYLSGLLIGDETIPEGTRMPSNTKFRKTWRVRNTGTKVWTGRTTLRFVWGHPELEPFGKVTEVQAPTLRPGEEGKVTIRFTSPNTSTITRYQSYWRLHHRGQPFGPRLVVKIIVDPLATAITPSPTPMAPILSKDSRSALVMPSAAKLTARTHYAGPTYAVNDTTCNLEAMAHISQSIFENQRNIKERFLSMSGPKQTINCENTDKTQKTSVKKLTEALSQVKEIRFDLDENESIPMKSNVKSHTTTPANTPFNVSPPKSPEPTNASNSFNQIESEEKFTKEENRIEIEDKAVDDKHGNDNESDGESLDVLSLSSGNESSDEFVLVPFPSCFDLNVPFVVKDVNSDSNDNIPLNKSDVNCFEIVDNETKNEEQIESEEDNTVHTEEATAQSQPVTDILSQPNEEIALDLTKDKQTADNEVRTTQPKEAEVLNSSSASSQNESEPQVRPKIATQSTNPFRNIGNENENVIHVLPESIVTGALSAAAHVYNNVSRALFSRNEGNNFAWVTSPPPAALPLPNMYWDANSRPQYPAHPQYYGPPHVNPMPVPATAPHMQPNASAHDPPQAPSRLASSLKQLYEMGFWNQKLNQELLEKNGFDVNDTIEDLLSPDKNRHNRHGGQTSEPVVSHQPTNNRNGFIDEFD